MNLRIQLPIDVTLIFCFLFFSYYFSTWCHLVRVTWWPALTHTKKKFTNPIIFQSWIILTRPKPTHIFYRVGLVLVWKKNPTPIQLNFFIGLSNGLRQIQPMNTPNFCILIWLMRNRITVTSGCPIYKLKLDYNFMEIYKMYLYLTWIF